MTRTLTAIAAAATLGIATIAAPSPARAVDPWTAAAWFVGGMFVGGLIAAPAYASAYGPYGYYRPRNVYYGYRPGYYGYAPAYASAYGPTYAAWAPPRQCYWTTIRRRGAWRNARVCY